MSGIAQVPAIFKALHTIQELLDGNPPVEAIRAALKLILEETTNIPLYEQTLEKLGESENVVPDRGWICESKNLHERQCKSIRKELTSSSHHGQLVEAAQAALNLGHINVRAGVYQTATHFYTQARMQSPDVDLEGMFYITLTNVIQHNWNKLCASAIKSPDSIPDSPFKLGILLNRVLGTWISGKYADCTSLVLSLDPSEVEFIDQYLFIGTRELTIMLVVSACISLETEDLRFLCDADATLHALTSAAGCTEVRNLLLAYIGQDFESVWVSLDSLTSPVKNMYLQLGMQQAVDLMRDRLHVFYISLRSQMRLSNLLATFANSHRKNEYTLLDLLQFVDRQGLALDIDLMEDRVEVLSDRRLPVSRVIEHATDSFLSCSLNVWRTATSRKSAHRAPPFFMPRASEENLYLDEQDSC